MITFAAYSTPARGLRQDHPRLPGEVEGGARRPERHLPGVLRRQHHAGPERGQRVPGRRRGALAGPRRGHHPGRRPDHPRLDRRRPTAGWCPASVVVFDVRPDNPKGIEDYDDLTQPGLQILTPDPAASGGARWNIVSAYGAAERGKVPGYYGGRRRRPAAADRHLQERHRHGQERPRLDQELRVRQRRRGHHVRERGPDRAEGRTPGRDGHPALDGADREPGGGRGQERRSALRRGRGQRLRRVPAHRRRPGALHERRASSGRRPAAAAAGRRRHVRPDPGPVHRRRPRRLGPDRHEGLRRSRRDLHARPSQAAQG